MAAGKRAVTFYATVDVAGGRAAWLGLMPLTGRGHQLRVHCAALGTPILGDRKYGGAGAFLPAEGEAGNNKALNFVTLGPRRILMPAGNTRARAFYEGLGVEVIETPMRELRKAAGAVGCLTGVVGREMAQP